jgi:hypothetical protein
MITKIITIVVMTEIMMIIKRHRHLARPSSSPIPSSSTPNQKASQQPNLEINKKGPVPALLGLARKAKKRGEK